MKIDILTLFPSMFDGFISESIIKRAIEKNLVEINIHNIRDFCGGWTMICAQSNSYEDIINFLIGYCYNTFSVEERGQLQNDWEIVRDYLQNIYAKYSTQEERNEKLQGFTHVLRPNLLLIELVPGFKKKSTGSFQKNVENNVRQVHRLLGT